MGIDIASCVSRLEGRYMWLDMGIFLKIVETEMEQRETGIHGVTGMARRE